MAKDSFKRRGLVSDMDRIGCFSPEIRGRLCLRTLWKASLPARAIFTAALVAVLSLFLAGCSVLQSLSPTSASTDAVQPSSPGATTNEPARAAPVIKEPDRPAPRPRAEPVILTKANATPGKTMPANTPMKVTAPATPLSVRARETAPAPVTVAAVPTPHTTEIPGALIFTGDKNAAKQYQGRSLRSRFGKNALKWVGGAVLLVILAYATCPPLRVRVSNTKDNLARRFDIARRKWNSRGKLRVKGGVKLAGATPFGDDVRRDQS